MIKIKYEEEKKNIIGSDIIQIKTINSIFNDKECIKVKDIKNNHYLMEVKEIFKINKPFNEVIFNVKYGIINNYLEIIE